MVLVVTELVLATPEAVVVVLMVIMVMMLMVVVMMTMVVMVIVGNSAGDDRRNNNTTSCGSIGVGYDFRMRHSDIPNSPFPNRAGYSGTYL